MATESQIRANRANALKSTGPVTPEGKVKSSKNATRPSLLARSIVLEGEAAGRFSALMAALIATYRPQTCVETLLIENMVVARWRQMRLWGMESAHMTYEIEKQASGFDSKDILSRDAPTRASIAFRTLSDNSRLLGQSITSKTDLTGSSLALSTGWRKFAKKGKSSKQTQNCFDLDIAHQDIPHDVAEPDAQP